MNIKFLIVLFLGTAFSQEMPCLIKREISPQETNIVERYLNQCSQEHLTLLNSESSALLHTLLGKDEVSIKISTLLTDLVLSINCKVVEEKHFCLIKAPILNYGQPIMGMSEYDPNYWMAKFHSQFFLRDQQYIFSPRQEFIMSLNTGASELAKAFNQLVFNFEVLDSDNYASVSISCEDSSENRLSPLCRIIF